MSRRFEDDPNNIPLPSIGGHLEPNGDRITDRGFRHGPHVTGRDGSARVYESSHATEPCVWIAVEETEGRGGEAIVQMHVDSALKFAEQIIRICRQHYQREE